MGSKLAGALMVMLALAGTGRAQAATEFIDKTKVSVPKELGAFRLVDIGTSGAGRDSAFRATYRVNSETASKVRVVLDVVAGVGRVDAEAAARSTAQATENVLRKQDNLSGLSPPTPLTVGLPPTFLVAAEAAAARIPVTGIVQAAVLSHEKEGKKTDDAVYLFTYHRDLADIVVTVFADGGAPVAVIAPLALEAAKTLVPAVEVRNFGTCGDLGSAAWEMQAAVNRTRAENCGLSEADERRPLPEGMETRVVTYAPGTWPAQPHP
jgi:hypothetical protein